MRYCPWAPELSNAKAAGLQARSTGAMRSRPALQGVHPRKRESCRRMATSRRSSATPGETEAWPRPRWVLSTRADPKVCGQDILDPEEERKQLYCSQTMHSRCPTVTRCRNWTRMHSRASCPWIYVLMAKRPSAGRAISKQLGFAWRPCGWRNRSVLRRRSLHHHPRREP